MSEFICSTISNAAGMRVEILNYGAIIKAVYSPDQRNLVLGFPNNEDYLKNPCFLGCVVGRLANRVSQAQFVIGDTTYLLADNDGMNCLHSGPEGLHQVFWDVAEHGTDYVLLRYLSPDGEAGFPGDVELSIRYTLTADHQLQVDYQASTNFTTPLDLTNHTYWNFNGGETILEHKLQSPAKYYLPTVNMLPTGEMRSVNHTPLDFTQAKPIDQQIEYLDGTRGYDHYYVMDSDAEFQRVATLQSPDDSVTMEVYSTAPGFQFYSGNFLTEPYHEYQGCCIETQGLPDAVNHRHFSPVWLHPDSDYHQRTYYAFKYQQ